MSDSKTVGKACRTRARADQKPISINYIRKLKNLIDEKGAEKGAIITDGKYTYSARANAPKMGIERTRARIQLCSQ